ncbi:MAG: dolichol kinase [Thermoproteota archaeon]
MTIINELIIALVLLLWVMIVTVIFTRRLYDWMEDRGVGREVAVYYNRKVIHIFAGGFCAAVVPYAFSTPFIPLMMGMLLALFTYIPHRLGKLMYWFQTEDNMYEVTFALMWGTILFLGWLMSGGDFLLGVLPVLFMSVGDAVTGVVRNSLYHRRTKSWWGNLAMAIFSIIVGTTLGVAGVIAGIIASMVEHFEFPPFDDNLTVPSISFVILFLSKSFAPWLMTF